MSLSGSDLLLLTVGQTFATVIPTLIITGFSFLSLIQVGLSFTVLPNHDRLQIALLITTVLGAIGSVISCYSLVQLIGFFADRYLKVNNATNLAQDVKDVLKKRHLATFFLVGFDTCLLTFGVALWAIMEAFLAGTPGSQVWGIVFVSLGGTILLVLAGHHICTEVRDSSNE